MGHTAKNLVLKMGQWDSETLWQLGNEQRLALIRYFVTISNDR
jgi:hypothetical protein